MRGVPSSFSQMTQRALPSMANLGWSPLRSAGADQKGTTGQEFCRNAQAEVLPRRIVSLTRQSCDLNSQTTDLRTRPWISTPLGFFEATSRHAWDWCVSQALIDSLSSSPCFSQVKNLDTTVEDADLSLGRSMEYGMDFDGFCTCLDYVKHVFPLFARHDCVRCLILFNKIFLVHHVIWAVCKRWQVTAVT
jgi:hypothetical protein